MVTRSTENYSKHKRDIQAILASRYGSIRAEKFIKFYSSRYDKYGRSFLDYRAAFWLMDDYYYTKNVGTRWFACVGVGGTGKTTLMKNILHFLDPLFNSEMLTFDMPTFINKLEGFKNTNAMRACLMDEPDDAYSSQSTEGKKLRKIFGKARQQHIFVGICATDLKDIPTYIYRKLDAIFFCPHLKKAMLFKNRPKKQVYTLQEIRNNYSKKGYKVFFELMNTQGCLRFDTMAKTPIDHENKAYIRKKAKDYEKDLKGFMEMQKPKTILEKVSRTQRNKETILIMKNRGYTIREISKCVGLSVSVVHGVVADAKTKP